MVHSFAAGEGEIPWCFSQVKGTIEDEVADGKDTGITSARGFFPTPHTHTYTYTGGRGWGDRIAMYGEGVLHSTFSLIQHSFSLSSSSLSLTA